MLKLNKKIVFSMLGLVVVMLIMGTLAGIAISKMGGSDYGAIKASIKSDMRGAIAAVNACYVDKLDFRLCGGNVESMPLVEGENLLYDHLLGTTTGHSFVLSKGNEGVITKNYRFRPNEFPTIIIGNAELPAPNELRYDKDSTSIGEFQ